MRPIDADRLKTVLEKNFGHTGGANTLAQLIDAQPSVQPAQRWIPCSERLPEHSGYYIVSKQLTKRGDYLVGLGWYSMGSEFCRENIIAWMPLPEPYREEGEG